MFETYHWASPAPKPQNVPAQFPGDETMAAPGRRKILVVEDDPIVSMAMENLLSEAGYQMLSSCARGEDAITAAERHRPDLMLVDVKLAGKMDGVDAAAAIRARVAVRIIFVTAHTDPTTRRRMSEIGPADILAKPVPDFLLLRSVAAALK